MALTDTISTIIERLRQGRFANEQAIRQGIIIPVFQELGWDTWDTASVYPEYSTGEGRVDYALCHPASSPSVFIEVKQPGLADNAVKQALQYAFHTGVQFVVLTDGQTWSFYLPAEEGSYEDRRVYRLDLFERMPDQAVEILTRYVSYDAISSGSALETARGEYRDQNRRAVGIRALPEAWGELVGSGDELLVELLLDAVESKSGVRPGEDDALGFLANLRTPSAGSSQTPPAQNAIPTTQRATVAANVVETESQAGGTRAGSLVFMGKEIRYSSAKDAMTIVLRKLAEKDGTFLQRCSQHPRARGTRRNYIAKTPEELYPHSPDLRELYEELPGGWLVGTNLNNPLKLQILRMAAEVAGLKFGTDIVVEF